MPPNITEDDFLIWREHPVTKWVFAAIERGAEAQREEWVRMSWDGGQSDPLALLSLRERADAYRALMDTCFERWSELNVSE